MLVLPTSNPLVLPWTISVKIFPFEFTHCFVCFNTADQMTGHFCSPTKRFSFYFVRRHDAYVKLSISMLLDVFAARLPGLARLAQFTWENFSPVNWAPRLAQVRSRQPGLARPPCKLNFFLQRKLISKRGPRPAGPARVPGLARFI